MSEHPDLLGMLRGELGNAAVVAAGDHLATCPTCQEELADAVVGHALLTRAGRTLGAAVLSPAPSRRSPAALAEQRSGRTGAVLVAAAVAVVVLVVAAGLGIWRSDDNASDPGVQAALAPVEPAGRGDGEVRMVEHDGVTRMTFVVEDLPPAVKGDFYYAWLLDPATNKMLPLGQVDARAGATFDLDDALLASYSAVDVSLETDDGDPAHSVTSVLRGTYEPSQITNAEGNQE